VLQATLVLALPIDKKKGTPFSVFIRPVKREHVKNLPESSSFAAKSKRK
jgi:hypothetical protein